MQTKKRVPAEERIEKAFNFAAYARETFLKASRMGKAGLELKRDILMSLGYNPEIKAGKLYLEVMPYYAPIKNEAPALQLKYQRLELSKKPVTKAKTEALSAIRAQWRCLVDYVGTFFKEQLESISLIPQPSLARL